MTKTKTLEFKSTTELFDFIENTLKFKVITDGDRVQVENDEGDVLVTGKNDELTALNEFVNKYSRLFMKQLSGMGLEE